MGKSINQIIVQIQHDLVQANAMTEKRSILFAELYASLVERAQAGSVLFFSHEELALLYDCVELRVVNTEIELREADRDDEEEERYRLELVRNTLIKLLNKLI
jgi:hypothetical protein